jgi:hypothetical protein
MACFRKPTLAVLLLSCLLATAAGKPKIKVASDGFPTGQGTPEGAASDLARAFMQADAAWFRRVCIPPYRGGQSRSDYVEYLSGVSAHLEQERGKKSPSPDRPTKITKVFAARHLSKNGPASYGYAAFGFQDTMFVDVEVLLGSGERHLRRTMVIKNEDGRWYVQPVPDVSPLLSYGLYEESASAQPFSDVYEVEH